MPQGGYPGATAAGIGGGGHATDGFFNWHYGGMDDGFNGDGTVAG